MFLLDTDTCIDVLRGTNAVAQKLQQLSPDDCCISVISAFELYAGVYFSRHPEHEKRKVDRLLDVVSVIPFDLFAAEEAARLRNGLHCAGTPIGPYDLLIAAQAICSKYTLVSANVREFSRIESLKLETWR